MIIQETPPHQNIHLQSYENGTFNINNIIYKQGIIIGEEKMQFISESSPQDLQLHSFMPALKAHANLILIGTGQKHQLLHPKLLVQLNSEGCALESMNTAAACRTFIMLQAEGRAVWAWLFP